MPGDTGDEEMKEKEQPNGVSESRAEPPNLPARKQEVVSEEQVRADEPTINDTPTKAENSEPTEAKAVPKQASDTIPDTVTFVRPKHKTACVVVSAGGSVLLLRRK